MKGFKKAQWIWISSGATADQYADFYDSITSSAGKRVEINISCDSDYTLYINGNYVASGQYGDFEHYKIYDSIDITDHLTEGKNSMRILAYHCGVATQRYRPAAAGLIYEITCDSKILAYSSQDTLSRENPAYKSRNQVFVTRQLGYTFSYDATKEKEGGLAPSKMVEKCCKLYPRPIKRSVIKERKPFKIIAEEDAKHFLVDLGGETVGCADLDIYSDTEQIITVAWGEHIKDGGVRKNIGERNFSFTYKTKKGENLFTDYMLRLGCRYLEVFAEQPIKINYIGLLPQVYETEVRPVKIEDELDRRIYDTCINTLNLCMMEHYVDCPWREQALYTFDSRNQMLCGYYAFKDKNKDYARANLKLIGEDKREDNLLSICYPCGVELAIPSFSLYYLVSVREYTEYTGDISLATEVYPKLIGICEEFKNNMKDSLARRFAGKEMWNFYDWTPFLDGVAEQKEAEPDLVVNCLFIMALNSLKVICEKIGEEFTYSDLLKELKEKTALEFSVGEKFTMRRKTEEFVSLGNALAVIAGVADREKANKICDMLSKGQLQESSLSMKIFEYEAMLQTDPEKYRGHVLENIRANYKKMLDEGTDTVWETLLGDADFDNAGSLCHGWSAVPVYIYHKLGIAKNI